LLIDEKANQPIISFGVKAIPQNLYQQQPSNKEKR
jgi:hypothetical protein